ncbi:hypothetical protein NLJ89_g9843 [Agrocybe chaxingu]|uniref:PCI domain-containing protein n=1 Tax=Agrocybe chaxingu TaxID=84603 RepID=A0A9W8JSR2_9AGAR|nr:hypothetical protein NLJ89_g9843 [Agrocybe chaxingu]
MSEEVVLPIPNLNIPQNLFVLSNPAFNHLHENARKELLEGIKADQMGPYYRSMTAASSVVPLDQALLEEMEKANEEELKRLDERLAGAQKTEGESEISDALKARANYLTRIGDKERSLEAQKLALEKTPGLGSRIDIVLTIVRIGFFFGDTSIVTTNMTKAEKLIDEGGDWDRRNRLKVYNGLHLISIRQFKPGGELLLDALSTFTATELLSYNSFVAYTVIANTLSLSRVDLKKRLISAPEVIQVLPDLPVLGDLVKTCTIAATTSSSWLWRPSNRPTSSRLASSRRTHATTLTLQSLSGAFGVSIEFVDAELSRFIASKRLHASIDKVHGVVETTRPSLKNAKYEQVVKKGDILLNEVQRLSKVLY